MPLSGIIIKQYLDSPLHRFASLNSQAKLNPEVFLLIKLKKERTHQEDRLLALWLATSAGLLNAIALGAFGFFPPI